MEYLYKLGVELKFNLESFQTEVIGSCKEKYCRQKVTIIQIKVIYKKTQEISTLLVL